MRRSDERNAMIVGAASLALGILAGLMVVALSSCISFAPWCVTKSGKHDCKAATAEMDSTYSADSLAKADTVRAK